MFTPGRRRSGPRRGGGGGGDCRRGGTGTLPSSAPGRLRVREAGAAAAAASGARRRCRRGCSSGARGAWVGDKGREARKRTLGVVVCSWGELPEAPQLGLPAAVSWLRPVLSPDAEPPVAGAVYLASGGQERVKLPRRGTSGSAFSTICPAGEGGGVPPKSCASESRAEIGRSVRKWGASPQLLTEAKDPPAGPVQLERIKV